DYYCLIWHHNTWVF
nr:immunoglobulin light chain junction region [Macaca mulatta]MOY05112.1 immunoglobulin light chain junction region [Macaca mulatta]MOY05328.1 immunoglobulin light chain junction region [Macaca mulatta]MOY06026.1 immunoglobulin light chain junction region [Macaca mulatta]MOY06457.1 immunoglobulin light chain junction region [Macaca mulatta]